MAAKHPINSFQQLKVHTETPESTSVPRNIETDISNIRRELKDINSALLSNKIHAPQDERNISHAEDGGMAAKHPINSFQQSKVHTEMPESTPVAQSIENLQPSMKDCGSTGDRSMLASKTLLRKTGGRDIYAHHSLQYLYTNDKHINESIEYFDFKYDYVLTEEDKEALHFITHSYQYAVVVDIAVILLTVKFLEPHVKDGWLLDAVIDAYAYIANIEDSFTSVITTTQSQDLSGDRGDFDPKQERAWIARIGHHCATCRMVFVPFNLWGCHWCLLVVNNTKKEIQILNSLAGVPHFRDEKKEITMVKNLQACIEAAVEAGFVTPTESIDLNAWERVPYTNIPQQNDSKSCGVYVIKYMLEWNRIQMCNNFTQVHALL
ncbi:uncharacterized protein LOC120640617 isoform X2 [Panicum virgatum]|uniref:Ubiquitin-like protease family profile domain-containing protein n=1 Tax=Panicum virgatum TaxID=38727 RepID=A0A8T0QEY6_PANVG|nr:uncharacterized protein LOC120640617 isoform X2 [Panicum virgatum]KAG2571399.1 hypothetical protein PVAP13_7KG010600 [Panicum virgatum]